MNNLLLVTGGSRGLGRSAALALAKSGVDIVFTYHSQQDKAEQLVSEIRQFGVNAAAIQLDLADSSSFPRFISRLRTTLLQQFERDSINYLVNNAGIGINNSFAETTEQQFDQLMNVHLKGTFFLTQALLPMIETAGRIVNISTGLTRFSMPGFCAYAMMKGGLEVMTRYLAAELGYKQIRANTLAPGAIETDFGGGVVRDNVTLNQQLAQHTALGRVGIAEDIGDALSMLLSDQASWVNGQRIEASGGMFL
ncbi:SDR family oxidoreductase [Agarivorans sp. B2Z047]|uniref:SDR family NAD(P)-dependent oxidoreductase n=1 Tax=Agarivorans sp. B2Z047 TaxID=2652721 RepID=UPI00128D9D46|nr:SDR family oxidoreductase [Agarivorans sp. B2Z047]MPW27614.1 SDR family oxidoreductase [Agarivorans sp. B2Z047]UQN44545.1 SDR family oxidoreductase [Agarivorans sp. B2Z047]